MKLHKYIIFLFLISIYITQLHARVPSKGVILANNIIESITEINHSDSSAFFINLQAAETDEINLFLLQQQLIQNGFIVVDTEQFADYSVTIRHEERIFPRKKGSLLKKDELFIRS